MIMRCSRPLASARRVRSAAVSRRAASSITAQSPPHVLDLGVGDLRRGDFGRERLQQRADPEHQLDLPLRPDRDGRPDIGAKIEQALDGQPAQRVAHRRSAEAEFGGKLGLLQPMAGRQPPVENAPAQLPVRPLGGASGGGVGVRSGNVVPQDSAFPV